MSTLPPDAFEQKEKETKPFLAHLEDLRQMLVRCIFTLVVTMSISFPMAPHFLTMLKAPLDRIVGKHEKPLLTMSFSHKPDPALVAHAKEADLILAIGTRLGEAVTQGYTLFDPQIADANPEVLDWTLIPPGSLIRIPVNS